MLYISRNVSIPDSELEFHAIRSQGAGGQNVNKLATAIHLRFDLLSSSLPDFYKQRLMKLNDQRISKEGIIVIKAQQFRSQEKNRQDAMTRLQALLQSVAVTRKKRKPTGVPRRTKQQRLDQKRQRGETKSMRRRVRSNSDY